MFRPPAWDSIMGLQFENLVLNNHESIWKLLNIQPEGIVFANPFFQRKTLEQEGCQIDYLIHSRYGVLYVCEIKFSKDSIQYSVVQEVQEKIARLKIPKRFSVMPVLIHVNGVADQVVESGYFSHSVDFADFLEAS